MPGPFPLPDLSRLKTYPLAERQSLVCAKDFAKPWSVGGTLKDFIESLPGFLGAKGLVAAANALAKARREGKTVLWGMGAHPLKVGLAPIIIDLMEKGFLSAVATNGAAIIHDAEIALAGQTSEDVAKSLPDGSFGMARETGEFLCCAIARAQEWDCGLGQAVGRAIVEENLPFASLSLFAAGRRLNLPMTVHVAIGTDIIHMHPCFDAAATGRASHRDFLLFAGVVATLAQGVYCNVGSAVLLPEVFLKAVSLARNLGNDVSRFTALALDFEHQYRVAANVVNRPVSEGGQGIYLRGHHEILIPLLAAAAMEAGV
ncbi:MAG: hypothetical protein QMD09_00970 [Desulfatibacillaceae bacterium]|nr:hypothetical protein [Desulfatibacillaceae bacterium]